MQEATQKSAGPLSALLCFCPPGVSLCSATLQWLLAENTAVDIVKAQALASVRGVAPSGADIHLIIREASRGQFTCPWGISLTATTLRRGSLDQ